MRQPRPGPIRRDWNGVVCFSCGKAAIAPLTGVTAWTCTGAPPWSPKVPQSVPVRVSVALVEETLGQSARKLPSAPDSVVLPTIAGVAPPADIAKVVAADAASLADTGILFPVDPVGTLSPTDLAGIPFPADPAGILFADLAEPVTVGVADLVDAGILFPADLVEPVTVGVADLADAGILFPAVPAGISFLADPAVILFPADLAEPVTVGVADLDVDGEAPLAGVADVMDSVVLPTIAGAAPAADVAKVVAADAASLADAGILSRPTLLGCCP